MVRGKGMRQALSESELNALRSEREEITETLRSLESSDRYGAGTRAEGMDKAALQRQDQRLRIAIENGSPSKISGLQKDKLVKEAAELEGKIKEGMLTSEQMRDPRKHPGAPVKHLNWEKKNTNNILRWKNIQRHLNPGDPTCSSIERLRSEK